MSRHVAFAFAGFRALTERAKPSSAVIGFRVHDEYIGLMMRDASHIRIFFMHSIQCDRPSLSAIMDITNQANRAGQSEIDGS